MALPVILGALAALAGGAGLGRLKAKEAEEFKARETGREVFLKALLSGVEVPDTIIKQYFGNENVPSFKMLGEAARSNQSRMFNQAMQVGGAESEGFPQPGGGARLTPGPTPAEMVPGDEPAPAWRPPMLLPSAVTPQVSAAPQAAPIEVPGGGLAPAQAPRAPDIRPLPGANVDTGMIKFNFPGVSRTAAAEARRQEYDFQQTQAFKRELSAASRQQMPYLDLKSRLDQLGLSAVSPQAQAALEQYGKDLHSRSEHKAIVNVMGADAGRRVPDAAESQMIKWMAWNDSKYGPMPIENQETMDMRYIKAMNDSLRDHPDVPISVIDGGLRSLGMTPSPKAIEQVVAGVRPAVERQVIAENPGIERNPKKLQHEVNKRMGFMGVSEQDRARADAPAADLPQVTKERLAEAGIPPVLERDLPGAPNTTISLPGVRRQAEAEDTATAAAKTKALAKAGIEGREEAAPGVVIRKPEELNRYIDAETGVAPAPMTQDEIDKRLRDGKLGVLLVPPTAYQGYRALTDTIQRYRTIVDRKNSVFDLPYSKRVKLRFASAPVEIGVGAGSIKLDVLTIPPDLMPGLRKDFTDQQINDINEILELRNTVVATLRGMGEIGQGVSSKLFTQGGKSFANLPEDDGISARAKTKALETRAQLLINSAISYPGRVRVQKPDGTTGTAPRGQELPHGWKVIR